MIDMSHDNSGKRAERQPEVARAVAEQVAAGDRTINGVMIESFLIEGNQPAGPRETLTYGQSITDALHRLGDDGAGTRRARRGGTRPPLEEQLERCASRLSALV